MSDMKIYTNVLWHKINRRLMKFYEVSNIAYAQSYYKTKDSVLYISDISHDSKCTSLLSAAFLLYPYIKRNL